MYNSPNHLLTLRETEGKFMADNMQRFAVFVHKLSPLDDGGFRVTIEVIPTVSDVGASRHPHDLDRPTSAADQAAQAPLFRNSVQRS
jgi:hypothetical protein